MNDEDMKETSRKRATREAIDATIAHLMGKERGYLETHWELAAMLGVVYRSPGYNSAMAAVRRACKAAGHAIKSERGTGYRVLIPREYAIACANEELKGARAIVRGFEFLEVAPVNDMDPVTAGIHREMTDCTLRIMAAMKGEVVKVNMLRNANPLATQHYGKA